MEKQKISIEKCLNKDDNIQDQIDDIIFLLIRERKKQKITQTELSKMTGVPQATISRLETFATVPTLYIILKLSNALNMKISFDRGG
jgi:predicted transcriptional regulator